MKKKELKKINEPLLEWFDKNARVLPWRERPEPYRVWVSEIMLQQTRVEAVKPFFARFIEALPNAAALAVCPEERLLKLWEGLGYYNRVRNMQIAAQTIVSEYGGELPADYEALLKLKGIGSYTAGAIASIAYGIPVPAVDGNVLRVISRVLANDADITKQSVKKEIEELLGEVMPKDRAGAYNQALMELGAIVCVPNGMAKCEICPLTEICQARKQNMVMELPKKTPKKGRRIEKRTVLIIKDGDRVAIHRRPNKGLLAGLYELPNEMEALSQEEVLALLKERGFAPIRIKKLVQAKHIFSHVEWQMTGYAALVEEPGYQKDGVYVFRDANGQENRYLFIEPEKTQEQYPIPAAFAAYTEYLQIKLGQNKYKEEKNHENFISGNTML